MRSLDRKAGAQIRLTMTGAGWQGAYTFERVPARLLD